MSKRWNPTSRAVRLSRLVFAAAVLLAAPAWGDPIPSGPGRFDFADGGGKPLPVWTYRPAEHGADDPLLFVMHGAKRNPRAYRKPWVAQAERLGALLILPEFSKTDFASSRDYQQVGVRNEDGEVRPRSEWAPQRIERLFDHVVRENGLTTREYYLYGHSAGGQFVHRMMMLTPSARVALALPANSGWYTLPQLNKPYPEGLVGAGVKKAALAESLAHRVVVMIGDEDNDVSAELLPKQDAAFRQGPHRLARAHYFFERIQEAADGLDCPLGWRLEEVAGVGHSNSGMAPHAADLIAEHLEQTSRARAKQLSAR